MQDNFNISQEELDEVLSKRNPKLAEERDRVHNEVREKISNVLSKSIKNKPDCEHGVAVSQKEVDEVFNR